MKKVSVLIAIMMPVVFGNYVWAAKSCMEGRTPGALTVAEKKGEADFTSIQAAINCASGVVYNSTPASSSNPYVIRVMPGTYKEAVVMKEYIKMIGSGRDETKITSSSYATIVGADNSSIENIWIDSTGATAAEGYDPSAILNDNTSMTINNVKVTINNPVPPLLQAYGIATLGADAKPVISNCTVYAKGMNQRGLIGIGGDNSSPTITDCNITIDTSGATYSFWNVGIRALDGRATVANSVIKVKGAAYNQGVEHVKKIKGSRIESIATSNTISNMVVTSSSVADSEIIMGGKAKETNYAVSGSRVEKTLIDGPVDYTGSKIVKSWDKNKKPIPNQ